jgi:hypothetical protein
VSTPSRDPVALNALEDFLLDAFRRKAPNTRTLLAQAFLEAYAQKGGQMHERDLALMAGNICPDTGKGYGLPSRYLRDGWPSDIVLPYKRLEQIVAEATGWEPGKAEAGL